MPGITGDVTIGDNVKEVPMSPQLGRKSGVARNEAVKVTLRRYGMLGRTRKDDELETCLNS